MPFESVGFQGAGSALAGSEEAVKGVSVDGVLYYAVSLQNGWETPSLKAYQE
jgi:hypothetical protein